MDFNIQNLSSGDCLKAFEEEYFAPIKPVYYYGTYKKESFFKKHFPRVYNLIKGIFEVFKKSLAVIIFPVGLVCCLVDYFRNQILSANVYNFVKAGLQQLYVKYLKSKTSESTERPFLSKCIIKRVPIVVDGKVIDGVICSPSQEELKSKKWVLYSPSSIEFYESFIKEFDSDFKKESLEVLNSLGYNVLVFNYPGVGFSEGKKSLNECKKAFLGYLAFLEDKEKGLGAEEITFLGPCLGSAVQSLGLEKHNFKPSIKYRAIYYQGMSSLYQATKSHFHRSRFFKNKVLYCIALIVVRCLFLYDWGGNIAKKVRNSKIPTVVAQAFEENKEPYSDKDLMLTDGILRKKATLAYGLFKKNIRNKNIHFLPSEPEHCLFSINVCSAGEIFNYLDGLEPQ